MEKKYKQQGYKNVPIGLIGNPIATAITKNPAIKGLTVNKVKMLYNVRNLILFLVRVQ